MITKAVPSAEPEVTPKIDGPASGFLKSVCISKPLSDSAAPEAIAVRILGNRDCSTISRFMLESE